MYNTFFQRNSWSPIQFCSITRFLCAGLCCSSRRYIRLIQNRSIISMTSFTVLSLCSAALNLVALHVAILQDIISYKLKVEIFHQMASTIFPPGKQIVHTYYALSLFQQFFTQTRADETGASSY